MFPTAPIACTKVATYDAFGLIWLRNIYFDRNFRMVQNCRSQISPNASYDVARRSRSVYEKRGAAKLPFEYHLAAVWQDEVLYSIGVQSS